MSDQLAPYETLVTLAESCCAHVDAERFDELAHVQDEFGQRLAELHGPAPAAAGPLLRRAFELHEQATAGLVRMRAAIAVELSEVRQGRKAAAGYAPAPSGAPARAINHAA
ncbi:MAG: hypothetical protein JHC95_20505 [Solirubrobacteraceae bacterium]|nr:hypothetical protein [Solirubrobacteraceae bacterium]